MNKWKIAFFTLIALLLVGVVVVIRLATVPFETAMPAVAESPEGNVVAVQTTTPEFEAIAKQYVDEALKNSPVPIDLSIGDEIYLSGEFSVFGIGVPIQMDFEPLIHEGNIRLRQTNVHVGKLNIPPQAVLKIMNDAVDFPDWITVRPKEEELYVDLSRITIADNSKVRAKKIDLQNDEIILEVIIPNN